MTALRAHARIGLAFLRRDFLLACSYRTTFLTGLLQGLVNLTLFYYLSRLVRVEGSFETSDEFFAYVALGIITLQIVTATFTQPLASLRQELVAGTFERILLSRAGAVQSVLSLMLYPVAYALFLSIGMFLFAALIFGMPVEWPSALLALPLAVLAAVAFAPFGGVLLAFAIVLKQSPPGANWVLVAISLVAGLYFPISLLPSWIQWTSEVQPFTPVVELLRHVVAGQSLSSPAWLEIAKLLAFSIVTLPAAVLAIRAAVRVGRRRGTIIEY